jgi:hypothetical protein
VHHRIREDQPVINMSSANDWSGWPPSGEVRVIDYPTHGLIRADRPASHYRLIAVTPGAIRLAANE